MTRPQTPNAFLAAFIFTLCHLPFQPSCAATSAPAIAGESLQREFVTPPAAARPWVYWYFMDGNLSREGITADLESMNKAGIGGAIFLEVNIGIPRGPVDFMSPAWKDLLKHAIAEAERLGIEIALGTGPGWCGAGGPWVKPEQSMQHLVASATAASGPGKFDAVLPQPKPRTPFFGEKSLSPELKNAWQRYYRDELVLAFPTPAGSARISNVDEKALYYRGSYSSQILVPGSTNPGVLPYIHAPAIFPAIPPGECIASNKVLDLTGKLSADGRLVWDMPAGDWTIMRYGRTTTGQTTRPAPTPGLGFEADKFDRAATDDHFDNFVGNLLKTVGEPKHSDRGLTSLHFDSWEMGSQNWSEHFRAEFTRRRGYDPLPFLPAMTGRVVDSAETSERFLWDLRQTAQELTVVNHVARLKELGSKHGMDFSLEPYDLNPCADLTLGGVADVPQCEFWSKGFGPSTEYSCIEAASIGHTMGRPIIAAEAFTSNWDEKWQQHPGSMKAQTDWALCAGINRFAFHRYQHQPQLDRFPGMTMGHYGVYWERTQTWWDMVSAYHTYLSRCQQMLRRGLFVADILYLAPEGAPHVFRPPSSAVTGGLPDRPGYNFDGCSPEALIARAEVKNGRIVFPDGMSYRILVMPRFDTMTPRLVQKIRDLVNAGATVIGAPPRNSPSLADAPKGDLIVEQISSQLWGRTPSVGQVRRIGKGTVIGDSGIQAAPDFRSAVWIWHNEGNPAAAAPPGTRFFQRAFQIEGHRKVESALYSMTADNAFSLVVNGHAVASGNDFHHVQTADVSEWLQSGTNIIRVGAENQGEQPNPAGLIGSLEIRFTDGSTMTVDTNKLWSSMLTEDGRMTPAKELGPFKMSPWNLKHPSTPDIYPEYAMTGRHLAKMGVPPDFESDGNLRYIHRREGNTDLYFIANRDHRELTTTCRFRVEGGRQPEWWNPLTGACRDLSQFESKGGVTTLAVRLDALESGFVVFRKPAAQPSGEGTNFPQTQPLQILSAPWELSFDPKWGGPEKIIFDSLHDWSKRPEPGVRNYSGKVVYRTTFDHPATDAGQRLFLSLGEVKNLASINLNGRDLGIVWCAPWRVDVPVDLLKARGNQLEITVANLWINRLIGDSALPEAKRLTWTTRNPYKPNSPLQPSGLLGPVQFLTTTNPNP